MGGGMGGMGMGGPRKDAPLTTKLPTTLDELYKGSTRKMKISRTIVDASTGAAARVSEVLTIEIKPGWKAGTKVRPAVQLWCRFIAAHGNLRLGASTHSLDASLVSSHLSLVLDADLVPFLACRSPLQRKVRIAQPARHPLLQIKGLGSH